MGTLGMATAAVAVTPSLTFGSRLSDRKVRTGIVGGGFGTGFFFNEHPNCIVEAVSDLRPERRSRLMEVYSCKKSYESLEVLLKDPKIEAVFIATGATDHARHVMQALQAGKHVLCAVPLALSMEDCMKVAETVKRTGLNYMMAETSTYRQEVITARKLFRNGDFGNIFSSSGQYYHPGLEELYFEQGKPTWRHGLPPMLYPTHVTSMLISVTGERLATASCIGWGDGSPILKDNPYQNPFWNETAFFKTNQGNAFYGEVCWRGALAHCERGDWRGDKMSFYMGYKDTGVHQVITTSKSKKDDGGFEVSDVKMEPYAQEKWYETGMLPEPMRHNSGHGGSHGFITNEFINSVVENRNPEIDIAEAWAYTVPGIIAHASALKGGETMKIPDLG